MLMTRHFDYCPSASEHVACSMVVTGFFAQCEVCSTDTLLSPKKTPCLLHVVLITLRGDKVSILFHVYPQEPLREIKVAMHLQSPDLKHITDCLISDLMIC